VRRMKGRSKGSRDVGLLYEGEKTATSLNSCARALEPSFAGV
jgi:hypothetical protein